MIVSLYVCAYVYMCVSVCVYVTERDLLQLLTNPPGPETLTWLPSLHPWPTASNNVMSQIAIIGKDITLEDSPPHTSHMHTQYTPHTHRRWKHYSFGEAKRALYIFVDDMKQLTIHVENFDGHPCRGQKIWEFKASKIASAGFSGAIQQTLVQQSLGLPDQFHTPTNTHLQFWLEPVSEVVKVGVV